MASNPFDYAERFNPANRRSGRSPEADNLDPVGAEIRRMREEEIRSTIELMPEPEQVARVTRVAREADVPPLLVEDTLAETERALQSRRFLELSRQNSNLARWALENPRGAAAAQDDTESLGILGSAWDFIKNVPGRVGGAGGWQLGGMLNDTFGMFEELNDVAMTPLWSAMSAVSQASGIDALDPEAVLDARLRERGERSTFYRERAERAREANRGASFITEGLLRGTESIPLTIGAIATRNPNAAATVMGALSGGSSYADARLQGVDVGTSLRYATTQGAIEAITERIPAGTLTEMIARKTPWGKAFIRELGQEMTGEQIATALQDLNDWAFLPENRGRTFADYLGDRPEAALGTALGVVGGTSVTTGGIGAVQRATDVTVRVADRVGQARQARNEQQFLDQAGKAVEGSKLRARDPEALRALLRQQAEEAGATSVYIPGEAIRSLHQSADFDSNEDPFSSYNVEEAAAAGGDIVVPIEDFLTDIVGTKAWAAIKDDVRLTPGGMSPREAESFNDAMDDLMAEIGDQAARQDQAEAEQRTVREKIVDRVAEMFGVSFTSPTARTIAELFAQRVQTRASRLGQELTGEELDGFTVKQVMPEGVAEAVKADKLDLVINAMRTGKSVEEGVGPSLIEFIKQRGGVNDTGGDLASMGVPANLLRDFDPRQGSLGGVSGQGDFGLDTTLRAAIEAGYFPALANIENQAGASTLDTQALLDAIAEEVAGRPAFAETRTDPVRSAADDLRAMLSDAGLDPDAMSDAEVRAAVEAMQQKAGEGGLQQSAERGPRGQIIFDQNKRIIELFQSRTLATPLHELSHMWLEELRFDAEQPDAPAQLKADWQTVKAYFAAAGHKIGNDGQIPTEAHELWARSGERYFMEGKAPTSALVRMFEQFRAWLVNIYKTVDRLKAPISPEIREVFDRLLATDEEIAAAQDKQALGALFKDAADIGMTEPEFQAYQRQVDDARAGAHASLLDKTMRAIRRRETETYREARKGVRAEQQERIDGSSVFKALATMKEQRVSREWIADEFGADALDLLPKRVPPLHAPGGVHPDAIAEQSGYSTGSEMIEALIGAERAHRQAKEGGDTRSMRERAIETATDEEMNRRYGDPLNDGSIEREAIAAVHSEMQGEVIASELRVLSRKTGQRPTPYALAREWARGKIRTGTVAQEASPSAIQRYARNAAKAGREAEAAMLKQDVGEAFRQKQFQMMNNALVAEVKAAADEVQSAVRRMDRIARAKTRKSVDQDYLEQAHALLEAVDLKERSQKSIERQGKWEAFAAAREAEGIDIVVPASFEATIGRTHWSRLSVENLLALDEAVKQVIHLGRLKQTLIDNAEEREWEEIYSEAEGNADNIGRKPPKGSFTDPSWWDSIKSGVLTMDAALLKMEQVFDWLDQGNISGVFNRIVFRPIADAQAREQDMTRDYFARIHDALEAVPKDIVRRWGDKVTLDLIDPATGLPAVFERKKLISMALNWGNAGNRQRLADGYGWSPQGVEAALMDNLSEAEWQFVQRTWDIIDTLWPEIEKMERAINGVAPEKVEAVEVVTPFGTMRGGYYPAIYDSTLDYTAEEQAGRRSDLFEAKYIRATTRASATKDRMTNVSRPILLDIGVINRHLGEVIHDVTHREAVMQAHKFLTSRRVMKAVDETLGPEVRKQFRPWLQHVANSWAQDRAGSEGLGKFFSKARANATVVGMGWRFTTMLTQVAGYSNSFEKVGAKWVSAAIAQSAAHPIDSFNFVMERSGEMRGRMDTLDRDIRAEMTRMGSKVGATADRLADAKRFAFHGIGYMDRAVSIPTWLGAYNKAISEGMTEDEAAYAGDKAIRLSQGAAGPKDLAAVATGQGRFGEAFKWLTMFYSYLSTVYSRQRNLGRDVRRAGAKDLPGLMARAWWLVVVPPLLAEILSGRGPDDDEDEAWWAFKRMLSQSLGAIPGVRDVAEPVFAGLTGDFSFGYRLSPMQAAGESVVKVAKDTGRIARGEETNRATRDAMEMAGYFTGLVPGQIAASTQFLVDVGHGEADPETLSEWYVGLTKGKLPQG